MVRKKNGFPAGVKFWILAGVLVFSILLLMTDAFRSHGIFKRPFCKLSQSIETRLAPSTSVVAVQPNFHVVAPGIWRSAQPNSESLRRMKSYGLKTIVNLRFDGETEPWENKLAGELDIRYFHFPISADRIVPSKTIDAILPILSDRERQPVLIHCAAGKDRTGTIIAAYKLKNTAWSFRDIYQEMKMYGFNEAYLPMLTTLRRWSGEHGFLEAAQQIALVEKELSKQKT